MAIQVVAENSPLDGAYVFDRGLKYRLQIVHGRRLRSCVDGGSTSYTIFCK